MITSAWISITVTQRVMRCHHRWYLCFLHGMIHSLIQLSCPRVVSSHPDLHITQRMSCKLLQYPIGIHLIRQIPCHRRPPIMEVAIFMDAWLMCLSWHRHNNNSMRWCYLSIIKSCVTRMNLRQCLYLHLLFPTLNHFLNPPYYHLIVDHLIETEMTVIYNNKLHRYYPIQRQWWLIIKI